MRVLIFVFSILFISFNLYAKETNLECNCLSFKYKNPEDKIFTNMDCDKMMNVRHGGNFTAIVHYNNNDVISHATSSLSYSVEGKIYNEYDYEVTFDFVWPWFWEKMEKWSYAFYRLKINKYNLDYEVTKYATDLTDDKKNFSYEKGSSDYYLDNLFEDREQNSISVAKGSCKLSEKKL